MQQGAKNMLALKRTNVHYIWCKLSIIIKKNHVGTATLKVLFGRNLVRNISTKATNKAVYFDAEFAFFCMQIRCRFNAHFSWTATVAFNMNAKMLFFPEFSIILYDSLFNDTFIIQNVT